MRKILIIDDNEELLFIMKHKFSENDYAVRTFSNPKHAIVNAILDKPDLVVCDLKMPGMSGMEVFDQINKNPFEEPVPFIILSGADSERKNVEDSGIRFISKNQGFNKVIRELVKYSA